MRAAPRSYWIVVFLVVCTTAACSSTGATRAGNPSSGTAPEEATAGVSANDEEASDLEALYWARQDSARSRFTEADVRFMTGMIAHHAQALVMARMAPTHGASSQIQTLAARIANAQKDEIASMQRWLRDRGQPVPEFEIEGTTLRVYTADENGAGAMHGDGMHGDGMHGDGMHGDGMHGDDHGTGDHAARMPGMLTQAQLDELDAARGPAFDRLFLRYMIQHHDGAVIMVDDLFSTDGAGQDEAAFKLAADINVDQQTEIERMKLMLRAMESADGTP